MLQTVSLLLDGSSELSANQAGISQGGASQELGSIEAFDFASIVAEFAQDTEAKEQAGTKLELVEEVNAEGADKPENLELTEQQVNELLSQAEAAQATAAEPKSPRAEPDTEINLSPLPSHQKEPELQAPAQTDKAKSQPFTENGSQHVSQDASQVPRASSVDLNVLAEQPMMGEATQAEALLNRAAEAGGYSAPLAPTAEPQTMSTGVAESPLNEFTKGATQPVASDANLLVEPVEVDSFAGEKPPGPSAALQASAEQEKTSDAQVTTASQRTLDNATQAIPLSTTQSENAQQASVNQERQQPEVLKQGLEPGLESSETPKSETPKSETSKSETPKSETPQPETAKPEAAKPETSNAEQAKPELAKQEAITATSADIAQQIPVTSAAINAAPAVDTSATLRTHISAAPKTEQVVDSVESLKLMSQAVADSENTAEKAGERSPEQQHQGRPGQQAQPIAASTLNVETKVSADFSHQLDMVNSARSHSAELVSAKETAMAEPKLNLAQTQQAAMMLKQEVNLLVNKGLQQVEIRLDPAELGSMQVKVQMHQEQASVQIQVQNPQAKELLEQTLPRLREMLAQQGIALAGSDIQQQQQQQEGNMSGQGQGGSFAQASNSAELEMEAVSLQYNEDSAIDYYA